MRIRSGRYCHLRFPLGTHFPGGIDGQTKRDGMDSHILAVEAVTVLVVWPLFTALLMARSAFTWARSLQISALTLAMLLGGDALLREWALHHAVQQSSNAAFFVRLQVLCITMALLISTAFARRICLQRKSAN